MRENTNYRSFYVLAVVEIQRCAETIRLSSWMHRTSQQGPGILLWNCARRQYCSKLVDASIEGQPDLPIIVLFNIKCKELGHFTPKILSKLSFGKTWIEQVLYQMKALIWAWEWNVLYSKWRPTWITSAASFNAREAFCSPKTVINIRVFSIFAARSLVWLLDVFKS